MLAPIGALAAPFAAIVMDARTGQVLHAQNADARLHPASLTKMMTLYVTFDAIRRGEISLDTMVTVSAKAAAEPPSRLGLRAGQRISMRNLIRAAAVRSANDAATAIAEAVGGSEAAFARRMTAAAQALGMKNTTFRNAHGLTAQGHLSTARDMTILGRRLFYDFPEYYSLFSRITVDAGVAQVANTNRRFLESYRGADGIKTGFTNAAGFNLTASAERGNKRLIATVFGGTSTAQRNARMAELLDIGFGAAPAQVATRRPAPVELPRTPSEPAEAAPVAAAAAVPLASAKTIRLVTAPARSPRPAQRPGADPAPADLPFALAAAVPDAVQAAIDTELREAVDGMAAADATAAAAPAAMAPPRPRPDAATPAEAVDAAVAAALAAGASDTASDAGPGAEPPAAVAAAPAEADPAAASGAVQIVAAPPPRPEDRLAAAADPGPAAAADGAAGSVEAVAATAAVDGIAMPDLPVRAAAETLPPDTGAMADAAPLDSDEGLPMEAMAEAAEDPAALPAAVAPSIVPPAPRPGIVLTVAADGPATGTDPAPAEIVTRISTSGGRHWAVTLGRFPSRGTAERALLQTGLAEAQTLGTALRKVVPRGGGYEAHFTGLTRDGADLACRRLAARAVACFTVGP
ncbi:MAG: D-alanyl-D-alanine carboxypeptidase family protein [Gemmobacter sp.]